jgi:hypothetical protein
MFSEGRSWTATRVRTSSRPGQTCRLRDPESMIEMVRPTAFGAGEGKAMLSHMKTMFDNGDVAVHPSFTDVIIALRSA